MKMRKVYKTAEKSIEQLLENTFVLITSTVVSESASVNV